MQQLDQNPFSLFLFRAALSCLFGVALVSFAMLIFGNVSAPAGFLIGFFGAIGLRKYFSSQIDMSYWWLAVYWELNIKNKLQK